jgi:hypothetical protein
VPRRTTLRLGLLTAGVVIALAVAATLAMTRPPGTSEVTGVVVAVEGQGLGHISAFTLRIPGGELQTYSLRALQNGTDFPPGHLAEHQATAAPVRVWFRTEGDERLAIRLEDAPP